MAKISCLKPFTCSKVKFLWFRTKDQRLTETDDSFLFLWALTKQNASPASDIGDEETKVAEPLHKKKKNIIFMYLVE